MQSSTKRALLAVTVTIASTAANAGVVVNAPVDVVANLPIAVFTATNFATQNYKDWGNEPSVAVNPLDPTQIVLSSFAFGTRLNTNAAIFYSTTGGQTWTVPFSVPRPSATVDIPNDWRFAYDSTGTLHAAILGGAPTPNIYSGSTTNPTSAAAWSYAAGGNPINNAASRNNADQPWIALTPGKVYVA